MGIDSSQAKLSEFLKSVENLTPEETGKKLEESEEIAALHASTSTNADNQTLAPEEVKVNQNWLQNPSLAGPDAHILH